MGNSNKQRIDIVISGAPGAGKSTMAWLIAQCLSPLGVEVRNADDDAEFLEETMSLMERRVDALTNNATAVISSTYQCKFNAKAYRGAGGTTVIPFDGRLYVSALATDVEPGCDVRVRRIDRDGDRISVSRVGTQDWGEWDAIDT